MACELCGKLEVAARNMCWTHYQAWRASKKSSRPGCTCRESEVLCQACYWRKNDALVKILSNVDEEDDCWVWKGRQRQGNGYIEVAGVLYPVQRYVHIRMVGPVGDSQNVKRSCDRKLCVNPDHLYLADKTSGADAAMKIMRNAGIEPIEPYPGTQWFRWKSLCPHCGNEFSPTTSNVKRGFTKGCHPCGIKRREAKYKEQGFRNDGAGRGRKRG